MSSRGRRSERVSGWWRVAAQGKSAAAQLVASMLHRTLFIRLITF